MRDIRSLTVTYIGFSFPPPAAVSNGFPPNALPFAAVLLPNKLDMPEANEEPAARAASTDCAICCDLES